MINTSCAGVSHLRASYTAQPCQALDLDRKGLCTTYTGGPPTLTPKHLQPSEAAKLLGEASALGGMVGAAIVGGMLLDIQVASGQSQLGLFTWSAALLTLSGRAGRAAQGV